MDHKVVIDEACVDDHRKLVLEPFADFVGDRGVAAPHTLLTQ